MVNTGVIAFGHVHFKAACVQHGLNWRNVTHITNVDKLKGLHKIILHPTAIDRRQQHLVAAALNKR